MRHCHGESVEVYEATNQSLFEVMAEVATLVSTKEAEASYINVTTTFYEDEYLATVYVHQ